ncbi:KOW domain-containing RNA-binding protein [Petrocella sp. FN5]|uniref:KOW domain-containing RNA-binding protein n=1 Tax=Petrocella sp. FN5 TaxID=3032002 RepID=UPI0023DCE57A|nr:KOW domain-containing RNA-binding protein [Petrocella sp. FN5]MDF1616038.1 KOW domain-containing RNA-binding protein [Petrocella sp. FN5]
MIKIELGQVVKSTAGRDCGELFIILDIKEAYVYIADGKRRRIEAPKKKKYKHIQITYKIADEIAGKLKHNEKITNADIRNSLKDYQQTLE